MNTQHTPIPWQAAHGTNIIAGERMVALTATVFGGANAEQEHQANQANAELIVRAVNAHEALLEACEATMGYWQEDGFAECEPDCNCIVDMMRAAIAKARGAE